MTTIDHPDIAAPAVVSGPEQTHLRAGFIPLVDAAVLIAAAELGFAAREGLTLDLVRDVSWANIRDRLAFKQFDVAHMLSPMPIAAMLELGSNPSPTIAPFALGRGGNAITLSVRLFEAMQARAGLADDASALDCAKALATIIAGRKQSGMPPLTLGMTYPYSSHNYELRYWLAAGGIDPDRDVRLAVVPPPMTSDALSAGAIDGFCVGAPWNMIASEKGVGRIVATKQDIWASSPEKVLGMRPDWADRNRDSVSRLIVALAAAARWCDDPANHDALADILAQAAYVGAPAEIIRHVLAGQFALDAKGNRRAVPNYFVFHGAEANCPSSAQALWVYSQMVRWGQAAYSPQGTATAASAFRSDLYTAALGLSERPCEEDVADPFIDGRVFDPGALEAYIRGFGAPNQGASA
ncbi:CmpA/NrtA family ABC transporter substrate-binding protein [Pleomorphomonas sp. NRK KF1]|uniref:CmpA/NrtA family ABC transporter substrate-binding protein n=1 Tax=Pleomorphomonas sp. NRK KF1 TaxID=2943000 RepID=UPI002043D705|nr:CmpA/NrtA family ABC transporter substrate-binding protein [Pleomorphomonas sp. NRK KF1]MCM5553811.1 ABC transporter substrate-binding protein [Pleomorphomonas sp. NRK KF1]